MDVDHVVGIDYGSGSRLVEGGEEGKMEHLQ